MVFEEQKKLKVLSLFSGYGTDSFALKRIGVPYELIGYSDIDKWANYCFKQNHCPEDTEDKLRLGDMTKIDIENLPDFDLLTAGFPCTDVSVIGKQDLSLGRTALGYILKDFLRIKRPKYFLFENVKGLMGKKFKDFREELFKQWTDSGYLFHYKVLNTKDYGIPQNRERVWFVGFREKEDYDNFTWPEPEELKLLVTDLIEESVDESFTYLIRPLN
jgi:DNA (cytosine-5)-methyltransferase 1